MSQASQRIRERDRPGLFSLAQIQYLLKVEFGRALRYQHGLLAMLIAIDGLEELCEREGYQAKERLFAQLVELLARDTRPFDFAGRLPGDRLLVVVPHVREERADTLGKRLVRKAHESAQPQAERGQRLSLSIGGGYLVPGTTLFSDELLAAAERALERAQAEGGDRCVVLPAGGSTSGP